MKARENAVLPVIFDPNTQAYTLVMMAEIFAEMQKIIIDGAAKQNIGVFFQLQMLQQAPQQVQVEQQPEPAVQKEPEVAQTKVCVLCKEEKPLTEFFKAENRGHYRKCKPCFRKKRGSGSFDFNASGSTDDVNSSIEDQIAYCQYSNCPRGGKFVRSLGFTNKEGLIFCSPTCRKEFEELNAA